MGDRPKTAVEKFLEAYPEWEPYKRFLRTHFGTFNDTITYNGQIVGDVSHSGTISEQMSPPIGDDKNV